MTQSKLKLSGRAKQQKSQFKNPMKKRQTILNNIMMNTMMKMKTVLKNIMVKMRIVLKKGSKVLLNETLIKPSQSKETVTKLQKNYSHKSNLYLAQPRNMVKKT